MLNINKNIENNGDGNGTMVKYKRIVLKKDATLNSNTWYALENVAFLESAKGFAYVRTQVRLARVHTKIRKMTTSRETIKIMVYVGYTVANSRQTSQ